MPVNLSGRSFTKLLDFTPEEINYLIDLSQDFKNLKRTGTPHRYLEGKNIVLLFQKTSTRTRCSFEVAGMDLGMGVTYLDPGSSQMGKKESIEDTARVLGRFYDGIEFRGFDQADVEELAARCRFRDCTHGAEPGCAVRAAVDDGTLAPERFESYRSLKRETAEVRARREHARWQQSDRRRGKKR